MNKLKKLLKWTGISLLGLVVVVLVAYMVIYIITENRINKTYRFADAALEIPSDSAAIIKGKHLYQIRSCQDCHGEKGEGGVFINDPLVMQITAPNLTTGQGGLPADFDVSDWVRVMRHGVDKHGKSLFMMPSHEVSKLTDEDLANIIAYCRQQEPVSTTQKRMHSVRPVGRLLMAINKVTLLPAEKIDHNAPPVKKREDKIGTAYGQYLATGCQGCHRPNLQGGGPLAPGFPPVPDITSAGNLRNWNDSSFIAAIRTGKTPEGKALNNEFMPWKFIRHFTDDELKSIYLYLKSLPEKR